jgi:hypothetical protein
VAATAGLGGVGAAGLPPLEKKRAAAPSTATAPPPSIAVDGPASFAGASGAGLALGSAQKRRPCFAPTACGRADRADLAVARKAARASIVA